MQTDDYILLWLKHPEFNWMYNRMGMQPELQPEGLLTLRNVSEGTWIVEWLDTVKAESIGTVIARATGGSLTLETPPTQRSIAARLQRLED